MQFLNNVESMYVLVREDLYSQSYKAVQGGHAVAEYLLRYKTDWNNGYMIYLSVQNEEELNIWMDKLNYKNINYSVFIEPDLNYEKTALACVCNGKIFKKLNLLCL